MNEKGLTYNRCEHLSEMHPKDIDKYIADYSTYDEAATDTFSCDNEGQLNSGYGSSYAFDYEHRITVIK